MHPIPSLIPDPAGDAAKKHVIGHEADLLGEFASCRGFRRLTVPNAAAREVPRDPV
jgi:hypothetical protein